MTSSPPLALVTGASKGVGHELVRQFTQQGYDVLMCAEGPDVVEAARALSTSSTTVYPAQVDLSSYAGVERLWTQVRSMKRPVSAAALNVGIGESGPFIDTDLQQDLRIIEVNVSSTVHLAKRVLADMARYDSGRVLITSSVIAESPTPNQALYAASKTFLQSFSEAVQKELRGSGISLTILMPGLVETDFFSAAGMEDTLVARAPKDDPQRVAKKAVAALLKGRRRVVASSLFSKLQAQLAKVAPDWVKARILGAASKK